MQQEALPGPPSEPVPAPTPSGVFSPSAAPPSLLAWLDRGLREGRAGRVRAEYRAVLEEPGAEHVVIHAAGAPVSHALVRACTLEASGRTLRLGMIGLVYTDPGHRRRGLAARCIETALARLASRGVGATLLWSDRPDYYARLGFFPASRERLLEVAPETCRTLARRSGAGLEVAPPQPSDWPLLERLYAAKPSFVHRAAGRLRRLAEAPECRLVVCRQAGRAIAYAALGKGDDFRGVVHEWAGRKDGVLACLEALAEPGANLLVLAGPSEEPATAALAASAARALERPLGLVHLGDADAVFAALAGTHPALAGLRLRPDERAYRFGRAGAEVALDAHQALELLFGHGPSPGALGPLDAEQRCAMQEQFPWPLFVWGFDSI